MSDYNFSNDEICQLYLKEGMTFEKLGKLVSKGATTVWKIVKNSDNEDVINKLNKKSKIIECSCCICGETEQQLTRWKDGRVMCKRHYSQMLEHGKIIKPHKKRKDNDIIFYDDYAEIILRNQHEEEVKRTKASLDKLDLISKYKWRYNGLGYVTTGSRPSIRLHRFIMDAKEDEEVDHINGDPLDNRTENLRKCTHQENSWNTKLPKNSTSGYKGVHWTKNCSKWNAVIEHKGKRYNLGYYINKEDAIKARRDAELKLFGKFSRLLSEEEMNKNEE